ncbi:unnamed protein product [Tilletia controversa]|uniref:Uncharacterized protein n=3 Tax=Tilletia TaxID=13289 RepID=A0A8X7MLQ4_9BASI|nr:hypothetical protein CF328_g6880 [Tilletia controversa]KAE8188853.1 hypothetical protein CF336_g5989 [Tilletia laevis]KAE8250350.1 hypothetical protein A4X03_0g6458 [Tilletia caries]KAE8190017.1 hypothetical protein CF335_g6472 [Tilletia laevis]KAE8241134.1 hypothetical protein A4X06_0g7651 [Tilletia controversa]
MRFAPFFVFAAVILAVEAKRLDRPKQKMLVSSPVCATAPCQITWNRGQSVVIEWLDAPLGDVSISLEPTSDSGLGSYAISKSVSGKNLKDKCKKKKGTTSCGRYVWHVPNNIAEGRYTVRIRSKKDKSVAFADTVVISRPKPGKPPGKGQGKPTKVTTRPASTSKGNKPSTFTFSVTSSSSPSASSAAAISTISPAPTADPIPTAPPSGSDDDDDHDDGDDSDDDDDSVGGTTSATVVAPPVPSPVTTSTADAALPTGSSEGDSDAGGSVSSGGVSVIAGSTT